MMIRKAHSLTPATMKRQHQALLALLSTVNAFQPSIGPTRTALSSRTSPPLSPVVHGRLSRPSPLFSLHQLLDEVTDNTSNTGPKTIWVGGKGGVGKTTVSSSLAVSLASQLDRDLKVLIVSTDPAHSLGDALDADLRVGRGKPVTMTDPLTAGRLDACEVDAAAALESFRANLASFDIDRLAQSLGVGVELLESLGLREFSSLLTNPPPGLDELVALSNVLDNDSVNHYNVVLVDTAPTGHTLRLLALPQFLDGLLGKLIKLRMKLSGLASTLQAFLGDAAARDRAAAIDDAAGRLEAFRQKMARLRQRLANGDQTKFVVVTVPTKLGVAESKRLVKELSTQGVRVTDIVVNQCIGDLAEESDDAALLAYYERRVAGQTKWIAKLTEAVADVSDSDEFRSNGSADPIAITKVPFFDVELVGVPALGYVGSQAFMENPSFAHLIDDDNDEQPKVVICGGKGGVGKTTTSASLAVSMAAKGHKVAIISTDPAHSLGDALDIDLAGGNLIDCSLVGVPGTGDGSLAALEIDPAAALGQFKGIVDRLVGGDKAAGAESGIRNTLRDLEEVFDTLPAGTDEVVALAKIVNLIKKGDYDRIVLDTAPTGHTLRMLSTPGFIAELIERLLMIAEKVNSNSMVRMLVSGSAQSEDIETAAATAKSQLLSFQLQMYDLEDMFSDAKQTEFLIVTVATELAARESIRLLNDLTFESPDMPIKVRNLVVNQVLNEDGSDARTFLSHIEHSQESSIDDLERSTKALPHPPRITKAQYLDTEPRGVFGLKVLADELLREEAVVEG